MNNILNRIAKADELKSVEALQIAINNGTIPGYIGVPMIAELVKNQKEAMALAAGAPQRTVTDQVMQEARGIAMPQMAASDRPPIPQQIPPQNPMPIREQVAGIDAAQSNLPTQNMASGGIVAFAGGDLVDDEYDPYDDEDNEEYYADMEHQSKLAQLIAESEAESDALTQDMLENPEAYAAVGAAAGNAGTGIKYKEPIPTSGIKADQYSGDKDQARKYNVGNLRPSGFTYKGQVGVSPGGFAMFDSREAGIAALNQDINAKLNRGLDTPTKFISVYAPASDKNDVGAYSANVARALGIGPNDKIPNTPEARQLLANAITRQEGAQYATAKFAAGGSVPRFYDGVYITDPEGVTRRPNYPLTNPNAPTPSVTSRAVVPYQAPASEPPPTLFQKYIQPHIGKVVRGTGAAIAEAPMTTLGIPAIGGILSYGAASRLAGASDEELEQLSNDIGSDTGIAAAIIREGRKTEAKKLEDKKEEPSRADYDNLTKMAVNDATKINKEVVKEESKGKSELDAQTKAEQTLFEQMQEAIKKRSAALEDEKSIDNYLAILQGFLGMMGGTSPYAMVNIGQGASSGISTLLAARKQTGLAERALGRDQMSLLTAQNAINKSAADRALREKLGIASLDEKWSRDYSRVQENRKKLIERKIEKNMDLTYRLPGVSKKLSDAAALGKTPDPKDVAEYNRLMLEKDRIQKEAFEEMPDPVRPGTAGGNFAGYGITKVK